MKSSWYLGLGLSLAVLLTGCSSGGGGGSDDDKESSNGGTSDIAANPGVYFGSIATGLGVGDSTLLLAPSGEIVERAIVTEKDENGVEQVQSVTYARGPLTFSASEFSGQIKEFGAGKFIQEGPISGTYTQGSLSGTGAEINTFEFERVGEISDVPARLDLIDGTWTMLNDSITTTINIEPDGDVTGSSTNGCNFNGTISIPDSSVNIYASRMEVTGCTPSSASGVTAEEANGLFTGYGFYLATNSGDEIRLYDDNGAVNRYFLLTK